MTLLLSEIIPLTTTEENPPASQVSSSFRTPQNSNLILSTSTTFAIAQKDIQIIGTLSPPLDNQNITIYITRFDSTLSVLATVETNSNGQYSFTWDSPPGGIHSVRANWSGNANYMGADTTTQQIVIIPSQWVMIGALLIFFLIILLIISLATRKSENPDMEPLQDWEFDEYL